MEVSKTGTGQSNIFERVRKTCQYASENAKHVKLNEEKLKYFAKQKIMKKIEENPDFFKNFVKPLIVPLKFDSLDHQINFLAMYALLQFGSGYRTLLHQYCNKGASDVVLYGLLGMVIHGSKLDTEFLNQFNLMNVEQYFTIPFQTEKPHDKLKAVKVMADTELKPLADKLKNVLNECGKILSERMCKDFAEFIRNFLSDLKDEESKKHAAHHLVSEMIKVFPSVFNDVGKIHDGTQVCLYKKAQLLVAELYKNLRNKDPIFDFPDIHQMTVYVDNVLPAVLVKDGVLELSDNLSSKIQSGVIIPAGEEEAEMRSVALWACERICKESKITALELDYFLWGKLGKEKEYRAFPRHATRDTVFY